MRALLVKTFRLAIIDEATGRPVIRICEVPEHLVRKTADFLHGMIPALQGLATVKGQVEALFGGSSSRPRPRRKGRG